MAPETMPQESMIRAIQIRALTLRDAARRKQRSFRDHVCMGQVDPSGSSKCANDLLHPTQSGPCGQARGVLSETAHSQPRS
jgi:hypothetical protein